MSSPLPHLRADDLLFAAATITLFFHGLAAVVGVAATLGESR